MKIFKQVLLGFWAVFFVFLVNAQTAHEINEKLGRGINYGNMLEAPSETAWGNPWQSAYPEIIADLGFNHVRIPIRWEPTSRSMSSAPYTIEPNFLSRVQEVIDETLENKLLAVINMHHHEALFEDPDGEKDRFLAQWEQISTHFKDYPDSLVFEILNEPHGNLTPEKWNEFILDALAVIRVKNPTRAVVIGTPNWGGLGGLPLLELPDDDHIILTIHYYNPFQFTHQGAEWVEGDADAWLGTEWKDTDIERDVVESEFAGLRTLSEEQGIPIHIGEFGAFSTADDVSRSKWTTFLARYFEEQGWSWAYWEFSAGFGIYNPDTETYNDDLVNALLINEMPEPLTFERTLLYQSDFTSTMDGWSLNVNNTDGASGQLIQGDNSLQVNIGEIGSQSWHIQLSRNGFSLETGKKYSFTYTGTATSSRNVYAYMGKGSPNWDQYGGASATLTETEGTFSGVFDMVASDPNARMVFDLGGSTENVTISDVRVEELDLIIPDGEEDMILSLKKEKEIQIFPNPLKSYIQINNTYGFNQLTMFNIVGQKMLYKQLNPGNNLIDIKHLSPGIYFVSFFEGRKGQTLKVIKD